MNKDQLKQIESEEELVRLLKQHGLFREDDVTFEELASGNMYVYTGDDFQVDAGVLADLEISALLVEGTVRVEDLRISDILPDYGVFCVTGDVRCKDLFYMTELTAVCVGGDLEIEHVFYADCGNSVLQVNKDLRARLFFNFQCSVDVRGRTNVEHDETISQEALGLLGISVADDERIGTAVRSYFERDRT